MEWNSLFWLIITLLVLLMLNRWITAHVQGVGLLLSNNQSVAIWLYFFLFLPGIFLHELSHYVMAVVLRVNVGKFSLWPQKKGKELVLGSVQVRGVGPLRHSLVGAAPLLFGSLAVLIIGRFLQFDVLGQLILRGDLTRILDTVVTSIATPDFWLWLYLLFAIANAMMPSASDRVYWLPVLLFLAVIVSVAVGMGFITSVPSSVQSAGTEFVTFMASALGIAVAVDVIFVIFIFLLEVSLNATTHRRMQY